MLEWLIIILLVLGGIGLLVVEIIFVPGTTVVGILGGVLVTFGIIQTFDSFGQTAGYSVFVISVLVGAGITIWGFRSKAWERFSLKGVINSKVNEETPISLQVGQHGKTLSACRPYGKAEFEDIEWEVRTSGNYLDSGTEIRIIKIDNRNIFVEPIK